MTIDFEEMSKDAFPALETLELSALQNVHGDIMNLSGLPHLKALDLWNTNVTGDIRNIGSGDFPSLESLKLPPGIYGGRGFEFQRISDAPDIIAAVSTLQKQRPNLHLMHSWSAKLSDNSPDWYEKVQTQQEVLFGDDLPFSPLQSNP